MFVIDNFLYDERARILACLIDFDAHNIGTILREFAKYYVRVFPKHFK